MAQQNLHRLLARSRPAVVQSPLDRLSWKFSCSSGALSKPKKQPFTFFIAATAPQSAMRKKRAPVRLRPRNPTPCPSLRLGRGERTGRGCRLASYYSMIGLRRAAWLRALPGGDRRSRSRRARRAPGMGRRLLRAESFDAARVRFDDPAKRWKLAFQSDPI